MGLVNNVKWVSCSQLVKVACQLLGMVIFSRYLTPAQIGLMSMTLIVVNFVNVLRDMGSSAAVIQREIITDSLKCSVFTLNLSLGIFLFICSYILSDYLAIFFNEPDVSETIRVISLAFPINSITAIHLALLERDSKFHLTAKVEVISSALALCISVILAIYGAGVYSLVAQTLLYSILSALGFWYYSGWIPKGVGKLSDIKSIFSFSSNLVCFNILNYFSRNADQIMIGRYFSASILGQYSLAYRVMLFPIQNITFVLTRSLYPILSRLQNDHKSAIDSYFTTLKVIAVIIPPLMFGVASVSKEFVSVVFGDAWNDIANMLVWLAPVAVLQSMVSTTGSVFMSQARTNLLLKISIYNAFLQITSFVIGVFYSVSVLIKLYLLANILMFIPNMYLAISMLHGSFLSFLNLIFKPIISACAMSICILISTPFFISLNLPVFYVLISKISIGVLSYSVFIIIFERKYVAKQLKYLLNYRKR